MDDERGIYNPETGEVERDERQGGFPTRHRITGPPEPAGPRMPAAIAAAIIAVGKQVRQLGHDDKNQHGGYKYVSVDKFYSTVGPMMADAGLALMIDETTTEVRVSERPRSDGKDHPTWLFATYALAFVHESGVMAAPVRRSLAMPMNGPQTYGSAQSYIEKQFLRQVFKVPTGERDADETAQSDEAPAGGRATDRRAYPSRQQAAPAPSEAVADLTRRRDELRAEIDATMTIPELDAIQHMPAWAEFQRRTYAHSAQLVADEIMGLLETRIERRKEALMGDAR